MKVLERKKKKRHYNPRDTSATTKSISHTAKGQRGNMPAKRTEKKRRVGERERGGRTEEDEEVEFAPYSPRPFGHANSQEGNTSPGYTFSRATRNEKSLSPGTNLPWPKLGFARCCEKIIKNKISLTQN